MEDKLDIPDYVLESLCVYDKRNPYYLPYDEDDLSKMPDKCACDNCYYGKDKIANYALELHSKIIEYQSIFVDLLCENQGLKLKIDKLINNPLYDSNKFRELLNKITPEELDEFLKNDKKYTEQGLTTDNYLIKRTGDYNGIVVEINSNANMTTNKDVIDNYTQQGLTYI